MTGVHYSLSQAVLGLVTIVCLGVFGYENYIGSQCNQTFDERAASSRAQVDTLQPRIDKILLRQKNLQSRSGEVIQKFDGPDSGQGIKQ
jgi:hypothetical protein